ncbi:MAG: sporulation protein YtxC [Eubacteriales bacterium]
MEYYFGAHRAKAVFMPALENKMNQMNTSCRDIEIENDEQFIKIKVDSLSGKTGETVCDAIFDIIEQVGQPRYLAIYLNRHYDFLSEDLRCNVLINTLKELWFCEDIFLREQITDKIKQYLEEESDTLLIDGFIDFRLKEFSQFWRNKVDENINKCFVKTEYDEFIDLLRAYVNLRPAKVDLVHVLQRDGEYMMLDDGGKTIDTSDIFDEGNDARTVEDEIFSALLALAPARIIFHKSKQTNAIFMRLVQSVFESRVHVID